MEFEIGSNMFREVLRKASVAKTKKSLIELLCLDVNKDGLIAKGFDNSSVIMSFVHVKRDNLNIINEDTIYIEPRRVIDILSKGFRGTMIKFKTDEEKFYIEGDDERYYELMSDISMDFPVEFTIENGIPKPKDTEYNTLVKVTEPPIIPDVPEVTLTVEGGKCKLMMGDETSGFEKVISIRSSGENITVKLDADYLKRIFDLIKGEFIISINEDTIYVLNPIDWGEVCYILVTKGE